VHLRAKYWPNVCGICNLLIAYLLSNSKMNRNLRSLKI